MKLKTPTELSQLIYKLVETNDATELLNYINALYRVIKDYQILIDSITEHDKHVEY